MTSTYFEPSSDYSESSSEYYESSSTHSSSSSAYSTPSSGHLSQSTEHQYIHQPTRKEKLRKKAIKILRPWHEDITDLRKASGTSDYLCSQCQTLLPTQLGLTDWKSALPRIIKHRTHCRLCRLLIETICKPEYDPFKHPQVAEYLDGPHVVHNRIEGLNQELIKQKSFRAWLMFNRRVWPFGDRKAQPGEESRSVECDATHRINKHARSLADVTLSLLVQLGYNLASSVVVGGLLDLPSKSLRAPYIPEKHIKRHLPCYIEVKRHPTIPDVLDAWLKGYGRGPRAQLADLSHFRLSIEAEPTYTFSMYDQPTLHYAFVLDPSRINVGRSRMLLEHCERHHGSGCNEPGWSVVIEPTDFLRLIDVREWCLVEFRNEDTQRCRYVALSYLWGGAQNFTLNETNTRQLHKRFGLRPFLQGLIPKTIRDAMLVVQQMGERYLWVDALCIQQDDQIEKHSQIEMMDRIYGNAVATLAAADSLNANAGIPGVRPGSRKIIQLVAELQNGDNLLAHLPDVNAIEETPWNRRAWTLQERLLSRRLMIFEGGRLTWRCRGMTAYEHLPSVGLGEDSDSFPWLSIKPQYLGLNARKGYVDGSIRRSRDGRTIVMRSGTFTEYAKVIEQYTHRDMTYPSDVLGALAALLRIFESCFRCRCNYGLPEVLLDAAILWLPAKKLRRRILTDFDLPSWTWAGWVGYVYYEATFAAMANERDLLIRKPKDCGQERFRSLVRWYTKTSSGLQAINGNGLGIPLPLTAGQTMPVEWDGSPPGINDPQTLMDLGLSEMVVNSLDSTHLVFKTSISRSFQLAASITADAPNSPLKFSLVIKTPRGHRSRSRASLSGIITLDGDSPLSLEWDAHALVVLSEAEYLGVEGEEVREYDGWGARFLLYNVMLVQWNRDEPIARRLGVGRVYKEAWLASGVYIQTVILG